MLLGYEAIGIDKPGGLTDSSFMNRNAKFAVGVTDDFNYSTAHSCSLSGFVFK